MYYTQQHRSSTPIDMSKLTEGRVAWFQDLDGPKVLKRTMVFWSEGKKAFLTESQYKAAKAAQAEFNRRKHANIPFGPLSRAARREAEGTEIFSPRLPLRLPIPA